MWQCTLYFALREIIVTRPLLCGVGVKIKAPFVIVPQNE